MTLEELGGALYAAAQSCGEWLADGREWFADGLDNVFAGNFGQLTIGQAALALLAILAVAISMWNGPRAIRELRWAEAEAERLAMAVLTPGRVQHFLSENPGAASAAPIQGGRVWRLTRSPSLNRSS